MGDLTTKVSGLQNIAKIECGNQHCVALSNSGNMYTWGVNNYGECYREEYGVSLEPAEVQSDVIDIVAGDCITIYQKANKEVYVLRI